MHEAGVSSIANMFCRTTALLTPLVQLQPLDASVTAIVHKCLPSGQVQ